MKLPLRAYERPVHTPGWRQSVWVMAVILLTGLSTVPNAQGNPTPSEDPSTATAVPKKHVVLVSGLNRDPDQLRDKSQAINRLHSFFNTNKGDQSLNVLTAPDSLVAHLGTPSTKENILTRLQNIAETASTNDEVFFYFVGQANIVGEELRLNLPGPDLTGNEFAHAIAPIAVAQCVIILDCPGAGLALKALGGPNRILIAGARSDQPHSTSFSQYFVPALDDSDSDYDGDGRTSLLEAFQTAAQQIDARYRDQKLMKNETPLLEDDNDSVPSQSPWRYATSGKDGRQAATCFLRASDRSAPDPDPPNTEARNQEGAGDHEAIP